jgi:pyruvate kinase
MGVSGDTARLVSKYRPSVPIVTVTRNFNTSRSCHLYRGVYPCLYPKPRPTDPKLWQEDVDARLHWAMEYIPSIPILMDSQAMQLKLLEPGDVVIAIQGWRGGLGNSNTMRVNISIPNK